MTERDIVERLGETARENTEEAKANSRIMVCAADEITRLTARVAELEEGLKPFADHIDEMKFDLDNKGNELSDDQSVGWVYVTIGDVRRARALTEKHEGEKGE